MKLPLFLRALNSPFKPFKLKFYFGKVAVGVPYVYPRIWIPLTDDEILEKAKEFLSNEKNPFYGKDPLDFIHKFKGYTKAVPKKVGFDFLDLGWKTKWTRTDYRFEWSPVWSFVCFGYQLALTFVAEHKEHYWEIFLAYHYDTDRSKSREERIQECKEKHPQTWTRYLGEVKETIDYYELVIKEKYL